MRLSAAFPWALVAAIVTAAAGAVLAVWAARRKSREEERARQRTLFAEAYQAYAEYKEMPYAIRRRRHDDPPAERIRLSEIVRDIQSRMTFYETWIAAESPAVGVAYRALVTELRGTAGRAMQEAWKAPAITEDAGMNIPAEVIDLSGLKQRENEYTEVFQRHLERLAPWWPPKPLPANPAALRRRRPTR